MASVLVTGARRGIAFGIVQQLAFDPTIAVIFAGTRDPNPLELKELAEANNKVKILNFDPQDQQSAERAAKDVALILGDKGLDILINNAGTATFKPLLEMDKANFIANFEANLFTTQNTTVAFFDLLLKGTAKKVINISSILGCLTKTDGSLPFERTPGYSIAKAGLNMLTRWYAKEYGNEGFTFITLHPGYVTTALNPNYGNMTVEESATAILKIVHNATVAKDNGKFYNYDGSELPW